MTTTTAIGTSGHDYQDGRYNSIVTISKSVGLLAGLGLGRQTRPTESTVQSRPDTLWPVE